jgi:ABC-type multidrug transport system ATPase subunit
MQEDALLATATPREALSFSARMRLPATTTQETILELVEGLLSRLGLMQCADVLIGGPLIKGISGGEKKRTSVGVELITDPTVRCC